MQLLNDAQVKEKIKRLAIEMIEHNYTETEINLIGINNNGYSFSKLIQNEVPKEYALKVKSFQITLNPAHPLDPIQFNEGNIDCFKDKVIILIDDVANTGRTMFYAMKPFMDTIPKKIEVAVLVDRKHKNFPIKVDYVGLSLATTLLQNIDVNLKDINQYSASLS